MGKNQISQIEEVSEAEPSLLLDYDILKVRGDSVYKKPAVAILKKYLTKKGATEKQAQEDSE